VLTLQADNGCEFNNHATRAFFDGHGIALRMSCPYTSAQKGTPSTCCAPSMSASVCSSRMPPCRPRSGLRSSPLPPSC
jgi:hypothetical protein